MNEKSFNSDNQMEFHRALELLEQANQNRNQLVLIKNEKEDTNSTGWSKFISFINPFKCG